MFSYRGLNFFGLLLCIVSLAFAILYLEKTLYLDPCPLCILDRVVIVGMAVIFLIALIHNPTNIFRKIYASLCLLFAGVGIFLASRHIWLQNLPEDQVPECGPGLSFMLDTLPLFEVLEKTLTGSGSCADVSWTFAGMSIPEQTLVLFVVLSIISLLQLFRKERNHF